MKISHFTMTILSGLVWMFVGLYLLPLGLVLLMNPFHTDNYQPLLELLAPYLGGIEQSAIALTAIGLYVGFLKGRHVLGKAARKGVERIRSMPNPADLKNIYSPRYYILLGGMILLGMSIKFFGMPSDIRGLVDVAIGSALINGSLVYFRFALLIRHA